MNFLAHARHHLDADPWELAGTSLPDWLGAVDRRARVQLVHVEQMRGGDDPCAAVARGVWAHLEDDRWFHTTEAFTRLTAALARRMRAACPEHPRLRASFLAHLLVEMLLDATLDERGEVTFEAYYKALGRLDEGHLDAHGEALVGRPVPSLALAVRWFKNARFLFGYRADDALLRRLDGIARRARQPPLPPGLLAVVPWARTEVRRHAEQLLTEGPTR
ncbi:MAG: hypothetical protein ACO3JL_13900 [Myxococcota bacterium]